MVVCNKEIHFMVIYKEMFTKEDSQKELYSLQAMCKTLPYKQYY